jgi:hypothetical protein
MTLSSVWKVSAWNFANALIYLNQLYCLREVEKCVANQWSGARVREQYRAILRTT